MKRVWIIGAAGSGKSTLARTLANRIGARCIDLDELHWRPNWQNAPESEFIADLERAIEASSWVIAGNYSRVQSRFLPLADTVISLDYSFPIVLWQLLKRTTRRNLRGEPCCNGNRESLRRTFSRDSVVVWLFRTYNRRRRGGWDTKKRARKLGMNVLHFRRPYQCVKWLESWQQ